MTLHWFIYFWSFERQCQLRVLSLLTSSWDDSQIPGISPVLRQCPEIIREMNFTWAYPRNLIGVPWDTTVPSVFGYRLYLVFRESMPSNMLSEPESSCLCTHFATLPDCGFVPLPVAKPPRLPDLSSGNFCSSCSEVNITGLAVSLFFFLFLWGSSSLCKPCTLMMGKVM